MSEYKILSKRLMILKLANIIYIFMQTINVVILISQFNFTDDKL